MRRPPARLVAAALALYPPQARERYGEEIADLLDHSERPWRDLTNIAWNATLETARPGPRRPAAPLRRPHGRWWTLLTVLLTRHRTPIRHGRTTGARLVVVAATVVTPVACTAIRLLAGPDSHVTYLLAMGFTPLATVCTPFAFALMRVARRQGFTAGG